MKKTIHSEYGEVIASTLTRLREQAKLTQRDLAEKLDLAHATVANIELGERRVDTAEFYWICKACGASPQEEISKLYFSFDELD